MKRTIVVAAAAVMLLQLPAFSQAQEKSAKGPDRLEGMEYIKARNVILDYGWRPSPGDCGGPDVNDQTCTKYPEVHRCTGVGIGLCTMKFVRGNRCLILEAIGGAPQDHPGDTTIREVTFRHAPCPTG